MLLYGTLLKNFKAPENHATASASSTNPCRSPATNPTSTASYTRSKQPTASNVAAFGDDDDRDCKIDFAAAVNSHAPTTKKPRTVNRHLKNREILIHTAKIFTRNQTILMLPVMILLL